MRKCVFSGNSISCRCLDLENTNNNYKPSQHRSQRNWVALRWQRETTTTKDYWGVSINLHTFRNPLLSCPICTSVINCMFVDKPYHLCAHPSPRSTRSGVWTTSHLSTVTPNPDRQDARVAQKSINSSREWFYIFRGLGSSSSVTTCSLVLICISLAEGKILCVSEGWER